MSTNPEDTSQVPKLFRCPTCGAALEVVDAPSIMCKYCGNSVPVPAKYRPQKPQPTTIGIPQVIIQQTPEYTQQYMELARTGQRTGCIITLVILLFVGGITVFAILSSTNAINSVIGQVTSGIADVTDIQIPGVPGQSSGFAELKLEFGGKGSGPGLFDDPRFIAVDTDGNTYVADFDTGRVQRFDPDGKFEWLTTLDPDDNGNSYAGGLAADYDGNVYVTRSGDLIKLSAEDGEVLDTFPGSFPDTMYDAIAVDPNNTLYALHVSAGDNELIKLSADGEILDRWPDIVSDVNKDDAAIDLDLAVDGESNIYISSSFGKQVYIFNSDGEFTDRFGQEGDGPGAMSSPGAVAVDGKGRIYVHNFASINVYDANGNYQDTLSYDYTKGAPRDVAIDIQGNIYVLTINNLVLKFEPKERG